MSQDCKRESEARKEWALTIETMPFGFLGTYYNGWICRITSGGGSRMHKNDSDCRTAGKE